ncbi:Efflux pump azaK [Lachnellula suecica]|uniref:Efflux pump azaK n=1 Tax=Lachnellula suecica TaxID=602035 RepID=A0A8T9C7A6_9HELO|nr:Efflux pump azaK [Lachnellula suecica]
MASKPPADENTALLAAAPAVPINEETVVSAEDDGNTNGTVRAEEEDKPLPKLQMFLLCYARLIEPIAFFGIFPFLPRMVRENGNLKETQVGYYSGLIESAFSLTQMLLMISWGRASDRIGRRPVLVFSLSGVSIATAIFGLSKSIPQMVIFRCCAGIFAGTIVTIRTMISENSTPRTVARAFSFFAFSGNMGMFLGPLIGGALSNPLEQYPNVFGSLRFLKEFPYALPTFITGTIGASAALLCGFLIKEASTLFRKSENNCSTAVAPPMSTLEIIKSPGVGVVLFIYGHVMLLGLAYTAVMPVFWYTSPANGGYGFSTLQNSAFLAAVGISQSIWLLFIFPPLQRKFGTGGILRGCLYAWPIFFASAPIANLFLRKGWTTAFWILTPILQIGGSGVAMAFTAVQLALNDVAPSHETLGTLNGIALTLVSGIRTVGPAIFTSIFAVGSESQILYGYLVWVVLVAVALLGLIPLHYLPEKAEGKLKKQAPGNDE